MSCHLRFLVTLITILTILRIWHWSVTSNPLVTKNCLSIALASPLLLRTVLKSILMSNHVLAFTRSLLNSNALYRPIMLVKLKIQPLSIWCPGLCFFVFLYHLILLPVRFHLQDSIKYTSLNITSFLLSTEDLHPYSSVGFHSSTKQ